MPATAHVERPNAGADARRQWLWGLLLVAVTLIAYGPAWRAGFIWDDDAYLTLNPLISARDGLWKIWFSLESPSQYFPLTYTSFHLEHPFWGLNPAGYHIVNILLHAANALLLWRVLLRLQIPGAWLAAAIFALHPVQVESVAWITERKNVLMCFFYLLSVRAWLLFIDSNASHPRRNYALALLFCALALAAKTTACTLPVALLLTLWLAKLPITHKRLVAVAPFVALGIGMGLITLWWERYHQGTQEQFFNLGIAERILIAGRALWFYLGKLLWPASLAFSYPHWTINASDPRAYIWPLAAAVLGVALWLARERLGRGPAAAAIFFAATLAPVLGIFLLYTFVYSYVADHYQYVACIGPMALAAAAIESRLNRAGWGRTALFPAACAVLLIVLGVLTWRQSGDYRNMETLWRATLRRNPDSWLALNDLGALLYSKGQTEESIPLLRRALELHPGNAETENNLGAALEKEGQLKEAIQHYRKAVELRPAFAEAENNLGSALDQAGQLDEAIAHFQRAVTIRTDIAKSHHNLASALIRKGRLDEAIAEFQKIMKLQPDSDSLHYELGLALLQDGRKEEAAQQFEKEVAVHPQSPEAENDLGFCLLQLGRTAQAIEHLQKAVEIEPDYAQAHFNLGNAWLQEKRVNESIAEFEKLQALQPDRPEARTSLAKIAWRLATSPDPAERNGPKALELARQLNQLAGGNDPAITAVLAATYAETGNFDQAIATISRVLQLDSARNNPAMSAALELQLKSYQAHAPYRDATAGN